MFMNDGILKLLGNGRIVVASSICQTNLAFEENIIFLQKECKRSVHEVVLRVRSVKRLKGQVGGGKTIIIAHE